MVPLYGQSYYCLYLKRRKQRLSEIIEMVDPGQFGFMALHLLLEILFVAF